MVKTATKTPSNARPLLEWMGALADATRLRILRLLERQELGVLELCDILQLPQSTVSRHLKVLGDQLWVSNRREGTAHLYRMILDELEPAARRLWLLAREQTQDWPATRQDEARLTRRLTQKRNDSQAFFAGAAGQWDKMRASLYGEMFSATALLSLLPSDYIVADLACGTGPVSAQVAPFVRQVIAVDNSAAMLKAAKKRMADFTNVDLRRGDLQQLPIENKTCDAALLVLALTYVIDPAKVLVEMSRILKPGGRAVVVDLLPHDREDFRTQMEQVHAGFAPEILQNHMAAAGFKDIKIQPLPPEANVKGPALFLASGAKV